MVRKENDGFFNIHAISFLTIAVFLTVFSVAYGDWYQARITGHVVSTSDYQEFIDEYLREVSFNEEYQSGVDACTEGKSEGTCPGYITVCVAHLYNLAVESDVASDYGNDCTFFFENVVYTSAPDSSSFNIWKSQYVTPYVLTNECQSYISTCSDVLLDPSSCVGLVYYCFRDQTENSCQYFENDCYVPETSSGAGSTQPPVAVIEQVSRDANAVRSSVEYTESVREIISTRELSESELIRYRTNLEEARRRSLETYKESSGTVSKYSSRVLSDYQEEIVSGIAEIEKQVRDIDKRLTTTVTQRLEEQREQANWEIEREASVQQSTGYLENFFSGMAVLVADVVNLEEPIGVPYKLSINGPSRLEVSAGSFETFELTLTNEGTEQLTNCRVSIIPPLNSLAGLWTTYPGSNGNRVDFLAPDSSQNVLVRMEVPSEAQTGSVIMNLQVLCTQEQANTGMTFLVTIAKSYMQSLEWFWTYRVVPIMNHNLHGETGLPGTCFNDIQVCYDLGQAGCTPYVLQCVMENNCDDFYETCYVTGNQPGTQTGYSFEDYEEFLNTYYLPYESQFSASCIQDIDSCADFQSCPYYVAACIQNHEPGTVAHPDCLNFLNQCSDDVIPSYSTMRAQFLQNWVSPYYNMPFSCYEGIGSSVDQYACYENHNYIYSCIVEQHFGSNLGGSCSKYNSACVQQSSPGGFAGGSSGGSGGGSGSSGTTTTTGGTTTGTVTSIDPRLRACQGNLACEQVILSGSCLTPSMIIALSLDLADFGGFGYDPRNGAICRIPDSEIYIRPGLPNTGTQLPGNTGMNNQIANSIISIHFKNSLDETNRNYVAAILYSLNGHLTLNFMNSPDYSDLEDRIHEFIQNLLYGESGGSYITGMSLQQAEEIVSQSASVPWVLWIILFVMVTSFVLFGNTLSPYNERLISSGKKALSKNDYALAIQNYNILASSYPDDVKIKQDALEYLRQIKERVGSSKINLEFAEKGDLPKIKVNKSAGFFSNYSRVHKMIEHALHDLKNNPKLTKSRMHLISEEYKKLTPRDREKLASNYESLVYKIRNL